MARDGATPKKHARAVLEEMPGLAAFAVKALIWRELPGGRKIPQSIGEDFFNVWDGILWRPYGYPLLVQWTTDGKASTRRRKVREKFCEELSQVEGYDPYALDRAAEYQVWGWVPRKGFNVWSWSFAEFAWSERTRLRSPGVKRGWSDEELGVVPPVVLEQVAPPV